MNISYLLSTILVLITIVNCFENYRLFKIYEQECDEWSAMCKRNLKQELESDIRTADFTLDMLEADRYDLIESFFKESKQHAKELLENEMFKDLDE